MFLFRVAHCVSANLPMCNITVRSTHRMKQTVNLSDKIYPVDSVIHILNKIDQRLDAKQNFKLSKLTPLPSIFP